MFDRGQDLLDDLKELLYPLAAPQRTRTVPLEVLAVGPARSGTDSLRAALIELGYSHTYHGYDIALNPSDDKAWWNLFKKKYRGRDYKKDRQNAKDGSQILTTADFDGVIGHCAAITDFDAAVFAKDLIYAYPSAKVILNIRRDHDAWFKSCQSTILTLKSDWRMWFRSFFCSELFWVEENFLRCLWPNFYRGDFEKTGKWVLEEHCAMVKGSVHKSNLLEWSPEDGWEPLCEFLGKSVPLKPFPHGNNTIDFTQRIEQLYADFNRRADINIAITISALLTTAFLVSIAIRYSFQPVYTAFN